MYYILVQTAPHSISSNYTETKLSVLAIINGFHGLLRNTTSEGQEAGLVAVRVYAKKMQASPKKRYTEMFTTSGK